jgi:site-specific recombinase XerC
MEKMNSPIENREIQTRWGWKGILASLLEVHGSVTQDKSKAASHLTHTKRAQVLYSSFGELRELGYKLNDPRNLKPKHIDALVGKWESDGQSPSSIQNKISIFRVYCGWIGKGGMIQSAESLVETLGAATRSYVATESKAWTSNGVSFEVIQKVEEFDARVGMQLRICVVFGLRMNEAIELKPNRADKDDYLVISDGTKGGRARVVPINTEEKRALLEQCKKLVGYTKNAYMGEPTNSLLQNKNRFYYVMRKFGITKEDLGVTAHGLRHEYVNQRYHELAGDKSPVEGGTIARDNPELDHSVRTVIAEEVGHTRPSIVSCYSGSRRTVKKTTPKGKENPV